MRGEDGADGENGERGEGGATGAPGINVCLFPNFSPVLREHLLPFS